MALIVSARRTRYLPSSRVILCDFLLPGFTHTRRPVRFTSTTLKVSETGTTTPISEEIESSAFQSPERYACAPKSRSDSSSKCAPLRKPLSEVQRRFLTRALRVNQAGELAATLIYASQMPPLIASHPRLRPLMRHMHDQEAGHFMIFNELLARHRVRPTAMYPVWSLVSSALGWGTAMLGREAAMACTEAVETEIGEHYNAQVRVLLDMVDEMERKGEEVGSELRELISTIRRIRDEELEHLDHAVENDAKQAVPYTPLTGLVRAGCKGAIWISERV